MALIATESLDLIRYYTFLINSGEKLPSTHFGFHRDCIVITQEVDDEDEPDKYIVDRNATPALEYGQFYILAHQHAMGVLCQDMSNLVDYSDVLSLLQTHMCVANKVFINMPDYVWNMITEQVVNEWMTSQKLVLSFCDWEFDNINEGLELILAENITLTAHDIALVQRSFNDYFHISSGA